MKNKICCIFNFAAHYRLPIYKLMDQEIMCHFYIGDMVSTPIKKMNYAELKGFKGLLPNKYLLGNFYWQKNSIKLALKSYDTYIITGEPYCLSTWILLVILKLSNKKTILWSHGIYGKESFMRKQFKIIFFKLSSKILLYGDFARENMVKNGFKPNKLITIYNSLDYESQEVIKYSLKFNNVYKTHFNNTHPVLIYVGRLQKVKKIDLLIQALYLLRENSYNYNLIIVGDNVDGVDISSTILKYQLENNIWLYGKCYDEKLLGELFYNATVCISPGNVGLTAIHSLSYGCPVITHNNFSNQMPEFEAIIEGETGAFFKEDDVEDLAGVIKNWVERNKNRLDIIHEKAYKVINEKYNPQNQVRILKQNIYND